MNIVQNLKDDLREKMEALKEKTQTETGSFKFDFAYDQCLSLLD